MRLFLVVVSETTINQLIKVVYNCAVLATTSNTVQIMITYFMLTSFELLLARLWLIASNM